MEQKFNLFTICDEFGKDIFLSIYNEKDGELINPEEGIHDVQDMSNISVLKEILKFVKNNKKLLGEEAFKRNIVSLEIEHMDNRFIFTLIKIIQKHFDSPIIKIKIANYTY